VANNKPTAMEKLFFKKAADGGLTEVELGRLTGKGGSDEVKDFGKEMVYAMDTALMPAPIAASAQYL
jgi:hypothetical protein